MKNSALYFMTGIFGLWAVVATFGWWQTHQRGVALGQKALEVHSATGEAIATVEYLRDEYGARKSSGKPDIDAELSRVVSRVSDAKKQAEELAVQVREEWIP